MIEQLKFVHLSWKKLLEFETFNCHCSLKNSIYLQRYEWNDFELNYTCLYPRLTIYYKLSDYLWTMGELHFRVFNKQGNYLLFLLPESKWPSRVRILYKLYVKIKFYIQIEYVIRIISALESIRVTSLLIKYVVN